MTKYYYECNLDKQLIINSFNKMSSFILENNLELIEAFKKEFNRRVELIRIYPNGKETKTLNYKRPGRCFKKNDKIYIEMWGYKNAFEKQYDWLEYQGIHEFAHCFIDILSELKNKVIVKNNIYLSNNMGLIAEKDENGNLINQHYYGKLFNETMIDLICIMINNNGQIDKIFNTNYVNWHIKVNKTSYLKFTTITRLFIASFANTSINYQKIYQKGFSIFNGKVNDFLYGIIFNPLYIDEKFDFFMGDGAYRLFCEQLDRLFINNLNSKKIDSNEVKEIFNIIEEFFYKRINYYLENKLIEDKILEEIIKNYKIVKKQFIAEYF